MDISFHYFAVKTIAVYAGFTEADAQTIAQYSQYVDDYNPTFPRRYGNVPQWIIDKPGSDIYIPSRVVPANFRPVTTGFAISADMKDMLTVKFQRNVISLFHFIPFSRVKMASGDSTTYPVKITDGGDGSIIANALIDVKAQYHRTPQANIDERRQVLMHIGMLLHTFISHQVYLMVS